jgi:hypothetical protein
MLLWLGVQRGSAQNPVCSYDINNQTNCTILVDYLVEDGGVLCTWVTGISISANGQYKVPCSAWNCNTNTPTDIRVKLTKVGTTTLLSPVTVDNGTYDTTSSSYSCTGCCTQPGNQNIIWNMGDTTITY